MNVQTPWTIQNVPVQGGGKRGQTRSTQTNREKAHIHWAFKQSSAALSSRKRKVCLHLSTFKRTIQLTRPPKLRLNLFFPSGQESLWKATVSPIENKHFFLKTRNTKGHFIIYSTPAIHSTYLQFRTGNSAISTYVDTTHLSAYPEWLAHFNLKIPSQSHKNAHGLGFLSFSPTYFISACQ